MIRVGRVCELVRYPVKSMAGIPTDSALLGWHGLDGDRRFAFRRVSDNSDFPFLSASRFPGLVLYRPSGLDEPLHVRTPDGADLELRSAALQREISEKSGVSVELMKIKNGIFDDAPVSVISLSTIAGIADAAGVELDRRRFRANVFLETESAEPFLEDTWIGGTLVFGDQEPMPAVSVTARDLRCVMVNLDPDTAKQEPRVMKTVVKLNANNAGVYGTAVRTGTIRVGQTVSLIPR